MYQNDEFTNKSNNLSTITREDETCYHGAINPSPPHQHHYGNNSSNNNNHANKFLQNLYFNYPQPTQHELTSLNPPHAQSPSHNNVNTFICSDDQTTTSIKENEEEQEIRRLKRMISNRESARRSRLRKRKQLENLQHQVCQLLAANHQLAEKLNQVMESNYQILHENATLRQEAALLQKNVTDLLMSMKGNYEEGGGGNTNNDDNGVRVRVSQAITSSSMDVLQ